MSVRRHAQIALYSSSRSLVSAFKSAKNIFVNSESPTNRSLLLSFILSYFGFIGHSTCCLFSWIRSLDILVPLCHIQPLPLWSSQCHRKEPWETENPKHLELTTWVKPDTHPTSPAHRDERWKVPELSNLWNLSRNSPENLGKAGTKSQIAQLPEVLDLSEVLWTI